MSYRYLLTISTLTFGLLFCSTYSLFGATNLSASSNIISTENIAPLSLPKHTSTNHVLEYSSANIVVTVKGMVCSFCAQGLKKNFESNKSIKDVRVTLESESIELYLKRFRRLSDKAILSIIDESGYDIEKIVRP